MGQLLSFEGRAARAQYWAFVLINLAASVVAAMLDTVLSTGAALQTLVGLAFLIPGVAISVRRYHDRDKSGWWLLLVLIPVIGWIWLLVELGFLAGTPGPNRFGPATPQTWDPRVA